MHLKNSVKSFVVNPFYTHDKRVATRVILHVVHFRSLMSVVFVVCCVLLWRADHLFRGVLPGVCLIVHAEETSILRRPRQDLVHFSTTKKHTDSANEFCLCLTD